MDGAKGSALEWALALLRAPGERVVLRQRPLPRDGMDTLLAIAAEASPDLLAEQARRFGETEPMLLEAARFYAREVLFHPQADAYRVLGVDSAASADQIKAHFRLLQLWLHPDRARSEDDAVFAARVNAAWNRLRSPDRRQVYDEALRQQRPPELFDSSGALRAVRTWVPADVQDAAAPSPWRRRAPVLALAGLCLMLAVLALRDTDPPDDRWLESSVPSADAQADPDAALVQALPRAPGSEPSVREAPARMAIRPAASGSNDVGRSAAPAPLPSPVTPLTANRMDALPHEETASSAGSRPVGGKVADGTAPVGRATDVASVRHTALADTQAAEPVPNDLPALPGAPPAAASAPGPSFARLQSAREAGEQLLHYLRTPTLPAPPIWNSSAVEASADLLRRELHRAGRVRTGDARWRVGGEQAVLTSGLMIRGEPAGSRQLTASLRWRDGAWLVTSLSMERLK